MKHILDLDLLNWITDTLNRTYLEYIHIKEHSWIYTLCHCDRTILTSEAGHWKISEPHLLLRNIPGGFRLNLQAEARETRVSSTPQLSYKKLFRQDQ